MSSNFLKLNNNQTELLVVVSKSLLLKVANLCLSLEICSLGVIRDSHCYHIANPSLNLPSTTSRTSPDFPLRLSSWYPHSCLHYLPTWTTVVFFLVCQTKLLKSHWVLVNPSCHLQIPSCFCSMVPVGLFPPYSPSQTPPSPVKGLFFIPYTRLWSFGYWTFSTVAPLWDLHLLCLWRFSKSSWNFTSSLKPLPFCLFIFLSV